MLGYDPPPRAGRTTRTPSIPRAQPRPTRRRLAPSRLTWRSAESPPAAPLSRVRAARRRDRARRDGAHTRCPRTRPPRASRVGSEDHRGAPRCLRNLSPRAPPQLKYLFLTYGEEGTVLVFSQSETHVLSTWHRILTCETHCRVYLVTEMSQSCRPTARGSDQGKGARVARVLPLRISLLKGRHLILLYWSYSNLVLHLLCLKGHTEEPADMQARC